MKKYSFLLKTLVLSIYFCNIFQSVYGGKDLFLLKKGQHAQEEIAIIRNNEPLYHLANPHIVVLDYKLLKKDFPFLQNYSNEDIDNIILDKIGYIAETQVIEGKDTNSFIPVKGRPITVDAIRQKDFGRALDLPFDDGYINVKGIGAINPKRDGHGDGLMTLGEALREFTYTQIVNMVFKHAEINYDVVQSYGVIYPGFSVKWESNTFDPAGFLLRRAYNRQNQHKPKWKELESFLNEYNIIVDRNIQTTHSGDIVDLGHAIMDQCPGHSNLLLENISNFDQIYTHNKTITTDKLWGFSKLDFMWNDMHEKAKVFSSSTHNKYLIQNTINKYINPIAELLFPHGIRNIKIKANIKSLTPVQEKKKLFGHRLPIKLDFVFNKIFKCSEDEAIELIKTYKAMGVNLFDQTNNDGQTLLHLAIQNNNIAKLILFIKNGAKDFINKTNSDLQTPLHTAIRHHRIKIIIQLLINNGAKDVINSVDKNGYSPLYYAVKKRSVELIKLLLDNGAKDSLNQADNIGNTLLHTAIDLDNYDIFIFLLNNGAKDSINKADINGNTPLHMATTLQRLEMVKYLLDHDAEMLKNKAGFTPKDIAFYRIMNTQLDDLFKR